MKIYEINEHIEDILYNYLDEETGEISVFASEMLTKLEVEKKDKCLNIAKYIKNLDFEAKALKVTESNIKQRRIRNEKKVEYLKKYLSNVSNNERYSDTEIEVSWRKSKVVIVDDIDLLPPEFVTTKTEKKADKIALKEALKTGKISGVDLEERTNIQIK